MVEESKRGAVRSEEVRLGGRTHTLGPDFHHWLAALGGEESKRGGRCTARGEARQLGGCGQLVSPFGLLHLAVEESRHRGGVGR